MNRKKQHYTDTVAPALATKYHDGGAMGAARLEKIVINIGIGREQQNRDKVVEAVTTQLGQITGQKPYVAAARISIAGFKIRQGDPVGVAVTLRGERMWNFFDKLVSLVLPQVKDFSGTPTEAFDNVGNYNIGLKEQIVFPEINYDEIDKIRGMQITFVVNNATSKEESREMLEMLGMPFQREE